MSRLLLVFALLVAVGLVAYLAWPRGDDGGYDLPPLEPDLREASRREAPREEAEPTLEGRGPAGEDARTRPTWPVIPSDRIPRGGLDVFVYGPDMHLVEPQDVRVTLERVGAGFWAQPLPRRDLEAGANSFRNVPFGKVVVRAWGTHLLPTQVDADVPNGGVRKVELFADRAGAIRYRATLPDDGQPEWVKLELLSARSQAPIGVVFQSQSPTLHGPPRPGTSSVLGPEGLVLAIPPGRYVLRATSAEGAVEEVSVEVEAAKTREVVILLRY